MRIHLAKAGAAIAILLIFVILCAHQTSDGSTNVHLFFNSLDSSKAINNPISETDIPVLKRPADRAVELQDRTIHQSVDMLDSEDWEELISLSSQFEKTCDIHKLIPLANLSTTDTKNALQELLTNGKTSGKDEDSDKKALAECPRYVHPSDLPKRSVGLISYPGSGNTWTRNLIQQLTGYQTGSVYNDSTLLINGFPGEGRTTDVIAVKSHEGTFGFTYSFSWDSIILVVRNPYDAIVSHFKYAILKLGHTKEVDIDPEDPVWRKFVMKSSIYRWPFFIRLTLAHTSCPILISFYEDMQDRLLPEILSIADFLRMPGHLDKFSFCCMLHQGQGNFHRNRKHTNLHLYSDEMRSALNAQIKSVAEDVYNRHPNLSKRLLEYIMS